MSLCGGFPAMFLFFIRLLEKRGHHLHSLRRFLSQCFKKRGIRSRFMIVLFVPLMPIFSLFYALRRSKLMDKIFFHLPSGRNASFTRNTRTEQQNISTTVRIHRKGQCRKSFYIHIKFKSEFYATKVSTSSAICRNNFTERNHKLQWANRQKSV